MEQVITNTNSKTKTCEVLLISAGVTSIAVGLVSIYQYLSKNNIKTELIIIDNDIDDIFLASLSNFSYIKLIGISIHWHPQISVSLKICELVKLLPGFKDIPIIAGGITAGYFAEELIKYNCIDYVIKGDGEIPLLKFYNSIQNNSQSIWDIPNLVYKKEDDIIQTNSSFQIDSDLLSELEIQSINEGKLFRNTRSVLSPGRGCKYNCIYCGGAKSAYFNWGNKTKVVEREKENLKKSIEVLLSKKKSSVYLLSDYDGKCSLISDVLCNYDLSTLKNITIGANGLPPIENIKRIFDRTANDEEPNFIIEISPESGSEEARKKIKAHSFTNKELENFLDEFFPSFSKQTIILYFSYFLPYENGTYTCTRKYICFLHSKYYEHIKNQKLIINHFPLSTDPGSAIQRKKIKELRIDANDLSDYNGNMLSEKYSTGNFLKHIPHNLTKDEADFLHHYFRFESKLFQNYPVIYSNLIKIFNSFEEYDNFLKKSFKNIYNLYIKNFAEIIPFAEVFDSYKSSLLGFNFVGDSVDPSKKLMLIWFSSLKNSIPEKLKINPKSFYDDEKNYANNLFDEDDKKEILEYVLELLDVIILDLSYTESNKIKNQVYSKALLNWNYNKINTIEKSEISILLLYPVFNNFCYIKKIKFSSFSFKPLNHNKNLLLFGEAFFNELLFKLKETPILTEYFDDLKEILGVQKINELHEKSDYYLDIICESKDHKLCEIISNIIILSHVPVDSILTILGIPHNGFFINSEYNLTEADNKNISINKFYGKFSKSVDVRLINFYLNYLRYTFSLDLSTEAKGCVNHFYLTKYFPLHKHNNISSFVIRENLNLEEKRALELCCGNNSLYQITNKLKDEFDINENYMRDMFAHLYNLQIIY